jgi:hypothetical protein
MRLWLEAGSWKLAAKIMYIQAPLEVENAPLVAELKAAIENALVARADEFLCLVKRFGLRVREFQSVLDERVFDQLPGQLLSQSCDDMYRELGASDQGLVREFYLTKIEEVPAELRAKYLKLFRYQ